MASNIPTSLVRSLSIPDEKSLVLLTSVLGATSNWIICRFLSNYLRSNVSLVDTHISSGVGVIFLSFLRSYDFWRDGTTRLGLDLDHRRRDGQFVYLDGLDGQISAFHRTPESHAAQDDNPLGSLEQRLNVAINAMRESDPTNQRSIVLMVDQIDLALALSGGLITSVDVLNMISRLRQVVYASVFTLAADKPLLIAQNTTLERQHSALVVALAHAAGRVISLRELDSGAASDVSGILRDSYGGTFPSHYDELSREYLYAIGVDGRFKATERC